MDAIASQIAAKVAQESGYFAAIVGLIGVVLGSVLSVVGNIAVHWYQERTEARKDKPRKNLLLKMLEDTSKPQRWRNLDTLMHVIGADEATTKRLLLEVGARASEDGQSKWGLLKYHPLPRD